MNVHTLLDVCECLTQALVMESSLSLQQFKNLAETWMDLEIVILSEVSQREKKYRMAWHSLNVESKHN